MNGYANDVGNCRTAIKFVVGGKYGTEISGNVKNVKVKYNVK